MLTRGGSGSCVGAQLKYNLTMDAEEIVTEVALSGGDENECQQACSNPGTNSSAAVTCPKVNIRNLVASTVREVKSMDEKTGKRQKDAM